MLKITQKPEKLLSYWKNPPIENHPTAYLCHPKRTNTIVSLIVKTIPTSASILELGCNSGANLVGLAKYGFTNLSGVDINEEAISMAKDRLGNAELVTKSVKEFLESKENAHYDLIFTLAVLQHIHPNEAEVVFDEMIRVSKKYIVTLENEVFVNDTNIGRNYIKVFTARRCRLVESFQCDKKHGLGVNFWGCLFEKL